MAKRYSEYTSRCFCFIAWYRNFMKYGVGYDGNHPACLSLLRTVSGWN